MNKLYAAAFCLILFGTGCKNSIPLTTEDSDLSNLINGKISPAEFISPDKFVEGVTNPYFPLVVGDTLWYHLWAVEDGDSVFQETYVTATGDLIDIEGVSCMVVHDVVFEDGALAEDTYDYYAQDKYGNVWYFGEFTTAYEDDGTVTTEGSFMHGVDGAVAGMIMLADPGDHIGHHYKQEDYPGHAMDNARIISIGETITVAYGTFTGCLKTEERTPLEPDVIEYKYYAPGIGQILATVETGGLEHEELVDISD